MIVIDKGNIIRLRATPDQTLVVKGLSIGLYTDFPVLGRGPRTRPDRWTGPKLNFFRSILYVYLPIEIVHHIRPSSRPAYS